MSALTKKYVSDQVVCWMDGFLTLRATPWQRRRPPCTLKFALLIGALFPSRGLAICHIKSAFLNESGEGDLQAHRWPDNGVQVGLLAPKWVSRRAWQSTRGIKKATSSGIRVHTPSSASAGKSDFFSSSSSFLSPPQSG